MGGSFIIAEIGNNHEGSFLLAKKMILEAHKCGADAVKFQVFKTEKYVSTYNIARFKRLKKFELKFSDFLKLKKYAERLGLVFFGTPFDIDSLKFLIKNCKIIKISSGDNNHMEFITEILRNNKICIISTGFLSEIEINKLIKKIRKKFSKKIIEKNLKLLHCVAAYPPNDKELNLKFIKTLNEKYKFDIGFSDHSLGVDAPVAAVALGAKIIEKHFTIDNNFSDFHDHKVSLNPKDMKKMIKKIRRLEIMLGADSKKIQPSEKKILNLARRSYYSSKKVLRGEILNEENLILLRPSDNNSLKIEDKAKIFNKKSKKNMNAGQLIKFK